MSDTGQAADWMNSSPPERRGEEGGTGRRSDVSGSHARCSVCTRTYTSYTHLVIHTYTTFGTLTSALLKRGPHVDLRAIAEADVRTERSLCRFSSHRCRVALLKENIYKSASFVKTCLCCIQCAALSKTSTCFQRRST